MAAIERIARIASRQPQGFVTDLFGMLGLMVLGALAFTLPSLF